MKIRNFAKQGEELLRRRNAIQAAANHLNDAIVSGGTIEWRSVENLYQTLVNAFSMVAQFPVQDYRKIQRAVREFSQDNEYDFEDDLTQLTTFGRQLIGELVLLNGGKPKVMEWVELSPGSFRLVEGLFENSELQRVKAKLDELLAIL